MSAHLNIISLSLVPLVTTLTQGQIHTVSQLLSIKELLSFITEQCILQVAFVQIARQSFKLKSRGHLTGSNHGRGPDTAPLALSGTLFSPWKESRGHPPILQRKTPFWKSNDSAACNLVLNF